LESGSTILKVITVAIVAPTISMSDLLDINSPVALGRHVSCPVGHKASVADLMFDGSSKKKDNPQHVVLNMSKDEEETVINSQIAFGKGTQYISTNMLPPKGVVEESGPQEALNISRDDEETTREDTAYLRAPISFSRNVSFPEGRIGRGRNSYRTFLSSSKSNDDAREDMIRVDAPVKLGRHRSSPVSSKVKSISSEKENTRSLKSSSSQSAVGARENEMCAKSPAGMNRQSEGNDTGANLDPLSFNSQITLNRYRSYHGYPKDRRRLSDQPQYKLSDIPEPRALFYEETIREEMASNEEERSTQDTEAFDPESEATVAGDIANSNTPDNSICANESREFNGVLIIGTEEEHIEKSRDRSEGAGVEVLEPIPKFRMSAKTSMASASMDGEESVTSNSSFATVQVANTRKYRRQCRREQRKLRQSALEDVKTTTPKTKLKPKRTGLEPIPDIPADAEKCASEENEDDYNLKGAFQVFTKYVSTKVKFPKNKKESNTPDSKYNKMVFM